MAERDREKWDRKYRENPVLSDERPPCRWLEEYIPEEHENSIALDVACGTGRNTLWLARHGWYVDAVDISSVALDILKERAEQEDLNERIASRLADLDRFEAPRSDYDLIVKTNYLDRPLIADLQTRVRPGGYFIVDTYLDHPENERETFQSDFLLQAAELPLLFADWEILAYEEYPNEEETHRMMKAGIVAQKLSTLSIEE
ncbi:methyltransferase domain-containing protein [Nitratifractor sp.]|uniref:class I SAM-dependent methyltransferase n=1 Tax=Nitratifractor sp. TaxID=2268144 RepID=UPI0025F6062B|nr:methyltransferase domain-containing protein [Nitratifractor sp.]